MFNKLKKIYLKIFVTFLMVSANPMLGINASAAPNVAMDMQIDAIEQMLSQIEGLNAGCDSKHSCGPAPVCKGRMHVLRDILNMGPVLDQYIQTLNAEDTILSKITDDLIANRDRNAAALEGARIASRMTHTTDQLLGAVAELNGIAAFITAPDLRNPDAVWELLKDANSIINRVDDATYGLDQHIESVRYVEVPNSSKREMIDLKNGVENAVIYWVGNQAGASDSLLKAADQQKSNISDAINTIRTAIKEAEKAKFADDAFDSINSYRKNLLRNTPPNLRATVQKSLDAAQVTAAKLGDQARLDSKRTTQLAAAQVVARLVQTFYSAEKLKKFRTKVVFLRELAEKVGDGDLNLIDERNEVRVRARQAAELQLRLNKVAKNLRECAFKNCKDNLVSLQALQLPDIQKRNGNLRYSQAQKRLTNTLASLRQSLAGNLENGGGFNPNFTQGENLKSNKITTNDLGAPCPECQRYADEASALDGQIQLAKLRQNSIKIKGNELAEFRIAREVALKEAEAGQRDYNEKNASGFFGSWAKMTEDQQTDLSELGSQIRRQTTKARTLGDEIKRIETVHSEFDALDQRIKEQRKRYTELMDQLDDCNLNSCKSGDLSAGLSNPNNDGSLRMMSKIESDQHRQDCETPDIALVDYSNLHTDYQCDYTFSIGVRYISGQFNLGKENLSYYDVVRNTPLAPFQDDEAILICTTDPDNKIPTLDSAGRIVATVGAAQRYSNGYRPPSISDTENTLKNIFEQIQSDEGLFATIPEPQEFKIDVPIIHFDANGNPTGEVSYDSDNEQDKGDNNEEPIIDFGDGGTRIISR